MAVDHQALLKQFEYLNHMNPHTFEVEDLDRLIKSVCCHLHFHPESLFDSVFYGLVYPTGIKPSTNTFFTSVKNLHLGCSVARA